MRKIKYLLEIGYAGCDDEGVINVGDDMSNADIDMMVNDMANEWAQSWEGDERLGFDNSDEAEQPYEEQCDNFYENVAGSWHWATEQDLEDYA